MLREDAASIVYTRPDFKYQQALKYSIGIDHQLPGGIVGSLVTTWVTFVPCFLWIFVGAPYIEALRPDAGRRPRIPPDPHRRQP